jgi:predicted secreted hydrolase
MDRRKLLRLAGLYGLGGLLGPMRIGIPGLGSAHAAPPDFPPVRPRPLVFPRDHGAHPDYRTEWWYATGWLDVGGQPAGFQVTFFRSRTGHDPANPSRFAPHQLLFAHAAIAWPAHGRLLHDQRAARVDHFGENRAEKVGAGGTVSFATHDTVLVLQGWRFERDAASGVYRTLIEGDALKLSLELVPTQPLLLQGTAGYSRKGPDPAQASYYYSQPQLAVRGEIGMEGKSQPVSGRAWLDHEWSTAVLDDASTGWDWLGINLDDGGALMAFRIRARDGGVRWAAARLRGVDGRVRSFAAAEVSFETAATWRSPRTGALYPVRGRLVLGAGAGALAFDYEPLLEDQELDTRMTTGAVYWEGAVTLMSGGGRRGRGYLELVGYHRPMKL